MSVVTISSKFQVVIPRKIREQLELKPGQKVQALVFGSRIVFIPVRPARSMRGFVRGLNTAIDRDGRRASGSGIDAAGASHRPGRRIERGTTPIHQRAIRARCRPRNSLGA